jgi:hypothetical protein
MNTTLEIANTIKQQIGVNTLMCIGAHQFTALPESDSILGGLTFKVGRNPKMKQGGTCTIKLMPSDTYNVTIVAARGKVLLDVTDVYCDSLGGQSGVIEGVTG